MQTSPEENLLMIEETCRFFKNHGKQVIFDAEHFFDGMSDGDGYALESLRAALRGGADAPGVLFAHNVDDVAVFLDDLDAAAEADCGKNARKQHPLGGGDCHNAADDADVHGDVEQNALALPHDDAGNVAALHELLDLLHDGLHFVIVHCMCSFPNSPVFTFDRIIASPFEKSIKKVWRNCKFVESPPSRAEKLHLALRREIRYNTAIYTYLPKEGRLRLWRSIRRDFCFSFSPRRFFFTGSCRDAGRRTFFLQ